MATKCKETLMKILKKMKKVLFFALLPMILGAVSVNAQVRIGGDGAPHTAAVLDLNATDAINNGPRGLALPRVSLANGTAQLNGVNPKDGMLVYNTNSSLGVGLYYWVTNKWVKLQVGGDFQEKDSVIGNEVLDATLNGGLIRNGLGTAIAPYTLRIADGGVQEQHIAVNAVNSSSIIDGTVQVSDLSSFGASPGQALVRGNTSWLLLRVPRVVSGTTLTDILVPPHGCGNAPITWDATLPSPLTGITCPDNPDVTVSHRNGRIYVCNSGDASGFWPPGTWTCLAW